ncbi:Hypothetical predicted protein [Mytilus galloprovincialis]|uniref:EGF-like domain-containing protein n=1 Tax=Mytilus galloprovincialis TaxID=29158 RepID=A0A8B6FCA8_MYTGA|nr:Hypothetical predicted protein [Mytilus galloprovincialis]
MYAIHIFILVLHHGCLSEGLSCFQCDHVAKPSDCGTANRCKDQELCSIRKYVSNDGHEWFDLGCSSHQRCIPIISIPVVGKRHVSTNTKLKKEVRSEKLSKTVRSTTETVVCEKCCTTDKCNAGLLCDTLDCVPNPCMHGLCRSSCLGYTCKCQYGYEGTNCDKYCEPNLCVHGVCKSNLQGYSCTCFFGYQGSKCDKYCDPNPCIHGVCINSLKGYTCKCHHDYEGTYCDKYCDPNPCSNMTCKHVALTYSCTCEAGHPTYKKDKGQSGVVELGESPLPNKQVCHIVRFHRPFLNIPAIVCGLRELEADKHHDVRINAMPFNVSTTGFAMKIFSWGESCTHNAIFSWMACPMIT